MIKRPAFVQSIKQLLRQNPVTALLGPRQCGKTTLARYVASQRESDYFDLENPLDIVRLSNPVLALERAKGLIVIDEIQRQPELFAIYFGCWLTDLKTRPYSWCWAVRRLCCPPVTAMVCKYQKTSGKITKNIHPGFRNIA